MKKFSLLVANYNNGKYFIDCYDSIMNQTYNNWEVIIVDDASTDNSVEIITSLIKDDNRFKLYKNETNKGCGYTKRKCAEFATGELCAYLDPDDTLYPHALERSELELENENLIGVYSRLVFCNETLEEQDIFTKTKQIFNSKYFFNCPIQITAFFTFKRSIYLSTEGINPDLKKAVDQDLYLKLLEHGNVKFIPEVLYKYRLHPAGISQDKSKQEAKDTFAQVIFEAIQRRDIKSINHKNVPDTYNNSEEIFSLLDYQVSLKYRLKNKLKLLFTL